MHWLFAFLLTASAAHASKSRHLFNGQDLSGWEQVGPGSFVVENGVLKSKGGMGLLFWKEGPIQNSVLRVVFQTAGEHDNSGIYVRIPLRPTEPWMPVYYGSEIQIDSNPERWGSDDHYYTGTIYSQTLPLARPKMKAKPDWNVMEIHLDGLRTLVFVNDVKVTDHTEGKPITRLKADTWRFDPRPEAGFIGLQNHDEKNVVMFKEISLRDFDKKRSR